MNSPPSPSFDPRNIPSGSFIGPYRVIQRLGEGGFGVTWLCERDGEKFAVKVSVPFASDREETPEERKYRETRAKREFTALSLLSHPNIVAVEGFERHAGHPYLVMAYVEGERLRDWAVKQKPSLRTLVVLFTKLSRALHYLHQSGSFHRDIKSGNILVRPDGEPVLIDFGIARPVGAHAMTRAEAIVGTYSHLSPEHVAWYGSQAWQRGEKFQFSAQTDLYALGYVLYTLLTGRHPYEGETTVELLVTIQKTVPKRPSLYSPGLPKALEEVVMRLLEKEPAARYGSGEELALALEQVLSSEGDWDAPFTVEAKPAQHRTAQASPKGRHKAKGGTAGGGGAAIEVGSRDVVATELVQRPEAPAALAATEVVPRPIPAAEAAAQKPFGKTREARVEPAAQEGEPQGATGARAQEVRTQEEAFEAPSGQAAFVPPVPPPPKAPKERRSGELPTAARELVAQLPPEQKKGRPGPLLQVLLLTGVALVSLSLLPRVGGARAAPPAPLPLPDRGLTQLADAPVAPPPVLPASVTIRAVPLAPPVPAPLAAPGSAVGPAAPAQGAADGSALPPQVPPGPARAEARSAARDSVPGSGRRHHKTVQAAAVDEILARTYGSAEAVPAGSGAGAGASSGPSATAGGPGASPSAKVPAEPVRPSWIKVGTRVDVAPRVASNEARPLGVPTGLHLPAILKTNLDSRTTGHGYVEALLSRAVLVSGEERLPAGTMLYGTASPASGRFIIHFTRLRFPDNTEHEFSGLAVDRDEQKPGLPAGRVIAADPAQKESLAGRVAKNGANQALSQVQGGPVQDFARGSAQTVVNDPGDDQNVAQDVLLLDAPYAMDVFVEKAF